MKIWYCFQATFLILSLHMTRFQSNTIMHPCFFKKECRSHIGHLSFNLTYIFPYTCFMQNIIIIESESVCNMHFYSLLYFHLFLFLLFLYKNPHGENMNLPLLKLTMNVLFSASLYPPYLKKKKMNIYFLFSRHSIFFPKELGIF